MSIFFSSGLVFSFGSIAHWLIGILRLQCISGQQELALTSDYVESGITGSSNVALVSSLAVIIEAPTEVCVPVSTGACSFDSSSSSSCIEGNSRGGAGSSDDRGSGYDGSAPLEKDNNYDLEAGMCGNYGQGHDNGGCSSSSGSNVYSHSSGSVAALAGRCSCSLENDSVSSGREASAQGSGSHSSGSGDGSYSFSGNELCSCSSGATTSTVIYATVIEAPTDAPAAAPLKERSSVNADLNVHPDPEPQERHQQLAEGPRVEEQQIDQAQEHKPQVSEQQQLESPSIHLNEVCDCSSISFAPDTPSPVAPDREVVQQQQQQQEHLSSSMQAVHEVQEAPSSSVEVDTSDFVACTSSSCPALTNLSPSSLAPASLQQEQKSHPSTFSSFPPPQQLPEQESLVLLETSSILIPLDASCASDTTLSPVTPSSLNVNLLHELQYQPQHPEKTQPAEVQEQQQELSPPEPQKEEALHETQQHQPRTQSHVQESAILQHQHELSASSSETSVLSTSRAIICAALTAPSSTPSPASLHWSMLQQLQSQSQQPEQAQSHTAAQVQLQEVLQQKQQKEEESGQPSDASHQQQQLNQTQDPRPVSSVSSLDLSFRNISNSTSADSSTLSQDRLAQAEPKPADQRIDQHEQQQQLASLPQQQHDLFSPSLQASLHSSFEESSTSSIIDSALPSLGFQLHEPSPAEQAALEAREFQPQHIRWCAQPNEIKWPVNLPTRASSTAPSSDNASLILMMATFPPPASSSASNRHVVLTPPSASRSFCRPRTAPGLRRSPSLPRLRECHRLLRKL